MDDVPTLVWRCGDEEALGHAIAEHIKLGVPHVLFLGKDMDFALTWEEVPAGTAGAQRRRYKLAITGWTGSAKDRVVAFRQAHPGGAEGGEHEVTGQTDPEAVQTDRKAAEEALAGWLPSVGRELWQDQYCETEADA